MMKRALTLLLALVLLLSGCGRKPAADMPAATSAPTDETDVTDANAAFDSAENVAEQSQDLPNITEPEPPQFTGLDDPSLLGYVEDTVYEELVDRLNSDDYFVENVSTVYLSKEYLEEVEFNSQTNIFFGYSLPELDAQFEGTRYVFTLDENKETGVEPFEEYDDSYEQAIKNVAIGSGVILVCVTVSVVTGGAGATAVSMIFAASAKTGAVLALSSGSLGAVSAGITTGVQTGDFDKALKNAALAGSEGFKWGALAGSIGGGAVKAAALKGATLNGLTMNEAATIQKESKFHLDVIKKFHSTDEYELYKQAGLYEEKINGKRALIQKINWDSVVDAVDGRTNAQRVSDGLAPLDPTGQPYELHHIGQSDDSPLAVLTSAQHRGKGNTSILHQSGIPGVDHGAAYLKQKQDFWKNLLKLTGGGLQ